MKNISDMSILITGGGSGIGEGTASYFVKHGAKVTICGRNKDKLENVSKKLGNSCHAVKCDITKNDERINLIEEAINHGQKLNALINNAGNMLRGPITDLNEDKLLDLFHTNVISGMMLTGLAVPHLEKSQGAIIFIGSIHTRRAFPGASPYAATKGSLETLTGVLASELGEKKIRVNCVLPGAVPTDINIRAGLFTEEEHSKRMQAMAPMHALKRVGTSEEIAESIDYLIRSEWTTGASLVVDGGLSLGTSSF